LDLKVRTIKSVGQRFTTILNITKMNFMEIQTMQVVAQTNQQTEPVETRWNIINQWQEPVSGEIFDQIQKWWMTYTFMTEETALLLTLWAAHANMWKGFQVTPRLVIDSPTKGCGKSLVLESLWHLIDHAKHTGSMSGPAFMRYCSVAPLVFLVDEADQTFRGNSDLTGLLNNGYKPNGTYDICTGDNHEPTPMPVHSAVALAGIRIQRHLTDATLDRSVIVQMMKARPGDLPERFRPRKHEPILKEMGRKLLRWCNDNKHQIWSHETNLIPDSVGNREYDNWQSLISIAEYVNKQTTNKALGLMHTKVEVDSEDKAVQFITDCKRVYDKCILQLPNYGEPLYQGMHKTGIQPNALAYELNQLTSDDDPNHQHWSKFHAHKGRIGDDAKLMGRDCTKFLKNDLHVKKKSIRFGSEYGQVFEGFMWTDILDAQKRYAPMNNDSENAPAVDPDDDGLPHMSSSEVLVDGEVIRLNIPYEPGLDDCKSVSTYSGQEEEIPW
jgi:hypothetical protein